MCRLRASSAIRTAARIAPSSPPEVASSSIAWGKSRACGTNFWGISCPATCLPSPISCGSSLGLGPFADFLHPGLQFIYFLSGRLRYRHGAKVIETACGDALLFETRVPHGIERIIEEPVSFLMVTFTTRN